MNPKQRIEQAAAEYVSANSDLPVYKGIENSTAVDVSETRQTRQTPCVTVSIEGELTEAIPLTGTWEGDLSVSIEADSLNTTDAEFDAICSPVFELFTWSDLPPKLSASLENFSCLFSMLTSTGGRFTDGNNWVNTIRVHVVFCEQDM